jgi:hypothetical protein
MRRSACSCDVGARMRRSAKRGRGAKCGARGGAAASMHGSPAVAAGAYESGATRSRLWAIPKLRAHCLAGQAPPPHALSKLRVAQAVVVLVAVLVGAHVAAGAQHAGAQQPALAPRHSAFGTSNDPSALLPSCPARARRGTRPCSARARPCSARERGPAPLSALTLFLPAARTPCLPYGVLPTQHCCATPPPSPSSPRCWPRAHGACCAPTRRCRLRGLTHARPLPLQRGGRRRAGGTLPHIAVPGPRRGRR